MQGRNNKRAWRRMTRSWFSGRSGKRAVRPTASHQPSAVACDLLEPRVLLSANITGNLFNDYDGSLGVKDGNDTGIAGINVQLYSDANGNGVIDGGGAAVGVWINEIHYDNAGADAGEGVEIAGAAGADLAGWSVVLYNGNGGAVYDTISLSGTIDDEGSGAGALWFARAGIQNGSPDGIALVNHLGQVVEFLSYEGAFTAVGGAANGMTSTDIGVSETSTSAAGNTLQRTGSGAVGSDFTWTGPIAGSIGSLNAGQTVAGGGGGGDAVIDTAQTDASGDYTFAGVADGNYIVSVDPAALPFAGTFTTDSTAAVALAGVNSTGNDLGVVVSGSLGAIGDTIHATNGNVGIANVPVSLYHDDGDASFEPGVAITGSSLVITGVIDAQLSGGIPKAIELTAINNIADLSIYELVLGSNGGSAPAGSGFTLPAMSLNAGDKLYITRNNDADPAGVAASAFEAFFGFPADLTSAEINHNGDDAYVLYENGSVADVFGEVGVDGTGTAWEYLDGWAHRNSNTGPDSAFNINNWTFSGINVLDGVNANDQTGTPFPLGTFTYSGPVVGDDLLAATTTADANGNYAFDGLAPGAYWVRVSENTGPLIPYVLAAGQTNPQLVSVAAAQFRGDADFAFDDAVPNAVVKGAVWYDYDGNGQGYDSSGEPIGVGDVLVYLDANENGVFDSGVDIQTTTVGPDGLIVDTRAGDFTFTGVPIGNYQLRIETPAGHRITRPSANGNDYYNISITTLDQNVVGELFGIQPIPTAVEIAGNVFDDHTGAGADLDGVLQAGEPGIASAAVRLYADKGALGTFNPSAGVWFNELHYDDTSGTPNSDAGEGFEIAGVAGFDLTGWTVEIHTNSGGHVVDVVTLFGSIPNAGSGAGAIFFAADLFDSTRALALIDPDGNVVEFVSYEGAITASNGAALGLTSTDIGVAESAATPVGNSLQRIGAGATASDFGSWIAAPGTYGSPNVAAGQTLTGGPNGSDYLVRSAITDSNGNYTFTTAGADPLAQGSYWVVADTSVAPLNASAVTTTPHPILVTVDSGAPNATANIGIDFTAAPASIGGLVHSDLDGNGAFNGSDAGVDGATVTLTPDGGDGQLGIPKSVIAQQSFETGSGYSLTGAGDNGSFSFFNVYDKNSTDVTGNAARDGYVRTDTTPSGDPNAIDGDFFVVAQDTDGLGGGITPVTVTLDPIGVSGISNLELRGLFGAESSGSFVNFEASNGIDVYATLDGGTRTLVGSFVGNADGLLVLDANLNGVADPGEGIDLDFTLREFSFPIAGTGSSLVIEVELATDDSFETIALDSLRVLGVDPLNALASDDGAPVQAVTAAGGLYSFDNLDPGAYFVSVDASGPLAGASPTTQSPILVNLISGQALTTADFGFQFPATNLIAGQVYDSGTGIGLDNVTVDLYQDTNNNGVIDAGGSISVGGPVLISGVIDGDANAPKGIEIYVAADNTDLNGWTIEVESNGGVPTTWTNAFNFSDFNGGIYNQGYYYITGTTADMIALLPSATALNTIADASFNQNGNDAFRILDGSAAVVDIYGDPSQVADSSDYTAPWAYQDSYAYRSVTTGPSATFNASDWTFAGNGALVGNNSPAAAVFGTLAGSGDVLVNTTTTSGGGLYQFNGLTVGTPYLVDVDQTDADLGTNDTLTVGTDPAAVTLAPGVAGAADFGFNEGTVTMDATIAGRHIFYNQSFFDGNSAAANASDDNAIATDKTALLPGGAASFANYTSYSRGINGLMIDIADLADAGSLSASDFLFKVGNDNNPDAWTAAPAPTSVTVRTGAGVGGSDRVTILWADGAIAKKWLQVTVLANATTGLASSDVHYWGNAVGDSGNSAANTQVNSTDEIGARNNPRNFLNRATVTNAYDYNRDSLVNSTDEIIARNNPTNFANDLNLIVVPGGAPLLASLATIDAPSTTPTSSGSAWRVTTNTIPLQALSAYAATAGVSDSIFQTNTKENLLLI